MKKTIISVLKYVLFLGLGILLLVLAFKNIKISELLSYLKDANYIWFVWTIVLGVFSHVFRAFRWNQLIGQMKYKTSFFTSFYAVMIGYLANLAVPRLGEVSKCVVLSKKENIPVNALFGTIIAERVFDMIVFAFILLGVTLFQLNEIGSFLHRVVIEPMMGDIGSSLMSMGIALAAMATIFTILYFLWRKKHHKWKNNTVYSKISGFLSGLADGLKTIWKVENKAYFFFNTFMIWFLYLLMSMMPFYAFDATAHLGLVEGLTTLAIGSLGIIAPVPGGIGAFHFMVTELFTQLYGFDRAIALTYATASHALQTIMIIVVGAVSYALLVLNKRSPLNHDTSKTADSKNI